MSQLAGVMKVTLLVMALGMPGGCRAPEPGGEMEAPPAVKENTSGAAPDGWTLAFSDDFERSEPGTSWPPPARRRPERTLWILRCRSTESTIT